MDYRSSGFNLGLEKDSGGGSLDGSTPDKLITFDRFEAMVDDRAISGNKLQDQAITNDKVANDADISSFKINFDTPIPVPQLTTTARNNLVSPLLGTLIYNSTTNKLNVYTGSWEQVTSA